jgi:hypothetical protein
MNAASLLLVTGAALLIIVAALLIWISMIALKVELALRHLYRSPSVARDATGRPLFERKER